MDQDRFSHHPQNGLSRAGRTPSCRERNPGLPFGKNNSLFDRGTTNRTWIRLLVRRDLSSGRVVRLGLMSLRGGPFFSWADEAIQNNQQTEVFGMV
jgi:hypothetical protein